jgi:hypothetical protein
MHFKEWNPLLDDGDAFRLAVLLQISITLKTLPHAVYVEAYNGEKQSCVETIYDERDTYKRDIFSARRRAIVRYAASLDKD